MRSVIKYVSLVEDTLLKGLRIQSEHPHEPVCVRHTPVGWKCIGAGNYAAVFRYHQYEDWVVKVYAKELSGLEKEADVYERLGAHPAYSQLIYKGNRYLVLKRLNGVTLYDAFHKGMRIPERVIEDVNDALEYARKRGLTPCDVHGKNVMMNNGRGYVIDVSDFYKEHEDAKWSDLVKAYYCIYVPFFSKYPIPIPYCILNLVRRSYRLYRKWYKQKN